jgi:DNA-directed RNA polymerase I, II, and III subunit RPABC5
MILPVRCFTCGSLVSSKEIQYRTLLRQDVPPGLALTQVGAKRFCCRSMLLTCVDLIGPELERNALPASAPSGPPPQRPK